MDYLLFALCEQESGHIFLRKVLVRYRAPMGMNRMAKRLFCSEDERLDTPIIRLENIHKSFGNVAALRGLRMTVKPKEILGLLGDNGAGKSTLIKILSGLYTPDTGHLFVEGQAVQWHKHSVKNSRTLGIETVYQDRAVADQQPLWRNLFVGRHLRNRFGFIDVKKEVTVAQSVIDELGFSGAGISPYTLAGNLSGGERQGLAIGRAMLNEAKVVILDEPTTALSLGEVERVLAFTRHVKERGGSVVFITHSMDHVWEIADRFVIMAHGKVFAELQKADTTFAMLLEHMRLACN